MADADRHRIHLLGDALTSASGVRCRMEKSYHGLCSFRVDRLDCPMDQANMRALPAHSPQEPGTKKNPLQFVFTIPVVTSTIGPDVVLAISNVVPARVPVPIHGQALLDLAGSTKKTLALGHAHFLWMSSLFVLIIFCFTFGTVQGPWNELVNP